MRLSKIILAVTLSLLLSTSFIGCTSQKKDTRVAAKVNGTEVLEADITVRIEGLRIDQSTGEPMDDASWAQLLKQNDFTPATLREYIIRNQFAFYVLFLQKAEAAGITADAVAIDEIISTTKSDATSGGGTFDQYLKNMGFYSEQAYRWVLEANSIKEAAVEKLISQTPPPKADIDAYIGENAADFAGKRISIIVFQPVSDDPAKTTEATRALAETAHQELVDGADFGEVTKKYMEEGTYLAENGGDLGWGYETMLPQELQDALAALELNALSDVIEVVEEAADTSTTTAATPTSTFYILKYTDDFPLTEEERLLPVDVSKVPVEVVDLLTDEYVQQRATDDQNKYFIDLAASSEIVINPMPEGLSYDVDMSLAKEEETETPTPLPTPSFESLFKNEAFPAPTYDEQGLGISDPVVGAGIEAKVGDTVLVHYVGYLEDGTYFDDSYSRGETYSVTIGSGGVITGWDLGLIGMKVGGQRLLIIPPDLAYGSSGYGQIPGNATLYFGIELVSVNGNSIGYTSP